GNTLAINQATLSQNGYLSSTDFATFNGKLGSTSLSGASVISYNSSTGIITTAGGTFGAGNYTFPSALTVSGNTTLANASTTNLSANTVAFGATGTTSVASNGTLTTPALTIATISGLLKATSGVVSVATAGTDYVTPAGLAAATVFPFTPTTSFGTAANATSTLIGFNAGLYALASSTIGNGTQAGGLTINGGATTTGNLAVLGTGTSTIASNLTLGTLGGIYASNNSFAGGIGGAGFGGDPVVASGHGSLAFGDAQTSGGGIYATGQGSVALGSGFVSASNIGSIALGFGDDHFGGAIVSSGFGSFAGGDSATLDVISSGNGSFAFGDNITASANYATAFGNGYTN